jgi:hypothetical protein
VVILFLCLYWSLFELPLSLDCKGVLFHVELQIMLIDSGKFRGQEELLFRFSEVRTEDDFS